MKTTKKTLKTKKVVAKKSLWQSNKSLLSLLVVGVVVLAVFIGRRLATSQSIDINVISEVTPVLAGCGVRDFAISSFCDNGKIKQSSYACAGDNSANSGHNIAGDCLSYDEAYKVAVVGCANICTATTTPTPTPQPVETSGPVTTSLPATSTSTYCKDDSDCSAGYTCYQPPMKACPKGKSCAQVMPGKQCTSKTQAK